MSLPHVLTEDLACPIAGQSSRQASFGVRFSSMQTLFRRSLVIGQICLFLMCATAQLSWSQNPNQRAASDLATKSQKNIPSYVAVLPQLWVNNHECDPPSGVYSVIKSVKASGGDYAGTQAGLNQAIADWVSGADEWELIQIDAGLVLTGKTEIQIGAKAGATKCLRIQSSNPPPTDQTLCSHQTTDLPDGGNPRNPGCTNDSANLYVIEQTYYTNNAISCTPGANHVVVEDGEFRTNVANSSQVWVPLIGCGDNTITDPSLLPSHVGFQYNYIHTWDPSDPGAPSTGTIMGSAIEAECTYCWFLYNYGEKIHYEGGESHVAFLINTPGPQKWVGNFLEGGSSAWFMGGGSCMGTGCSPTGIIGVIPSDLEVRRNRFTRDITWSSRTGKLCQPSCPNHWAVKNSLEMKVGQRILLDGNIIENSWVDGQSGFALLADVRSCSGGTVCDILVNGMPVQTLSDLTVSNLILRSAAQAIQTDGRSGSPSNGGGVSLGGQRWTFANLLVYNMADSSQFGTGGNSYLAQLGASVNTFICSASRDSSGLVTLTCASGGQGYNETGVSEGDIVQVTGCGDSTFNTPFASTNNQSAAHVVAGSGTSPGGLIVYYKTSGRKTSTTGCVLSNEGGWGLGVTFQHVTAAFDSSPRFSVVYGSQSLLRGFTLQNSIVVSQVVGGTTGGGLTSVSPTEEGTLAATCCLETSTLTLNNNLFQGRTSGNYTEYGGAHTGASPPATLYFPSNISCAGGKADSGCVGFSGYLSGKGYAWNPSDYHAFRLDASSLYHAGGARQATDSSDLGANVPAIDAALSSTTYTCQTSCGGGPFPDHAKKR